MKLLIIEERQTNAKPLLHYLRREGYRCDLISADDDIPDPLNPSGYDCILLNSTTADLAAIRIIKTLKTMGYTGGIILLSIHDDPLARIAGLGAGADDYLTQPVNGKELSARIMTLIRRRRFNGVRLVTIGELTIDLPGKTALFRKKALNLTRREFDLLLYLAAYPNTILSKEVIATNLADGSDPHENMDFIYAHIKNLKKKLAAAGCPDYIVSVYAMGYKFTPPASDNRLNLSL